jgi:hypothetical protein
MIINPKWFHQKDKDYKIDLDYKYNPKKNSFFKKIINKFKNFLKR